MDLLMYYPDILNLTEIVRSRLYFAVVTPDVVLKNNIDTLFFNTDNEFVYLNYYYDFGPLNLSCVYKYCCKINDYLQSTKYKRIVHYTSSEHHCKANAAFLIGCFAVIYLRVHPREITKALVSGCVHFLPFADASQGGSEWKITLIDCFAAIQKANNLRFFNFDDFDVAEYDTYDKLANGDVNWLLPRKFLAFIGPTDVEIVNFHSPEFYIQYFIKNNVKAVIRLNNNTYNPSVFTTVGIEHYDLYFPDGSTPPKRILLEFLSIAEKTQGALAVHCKAGLGRTGSLIGAYIIKHYRFSAREAIAWLRICRPGSVIGQQQGWLEKMESWLWRQGNYFRYEQLGDCDKVLKHKYGVYSIEWKIERAEKARAIRQKELNNATQEPEKVQRQVKPPKGEFVSIRNNEGTSRGTHSNTKSYHESNVNKTKDYHQPSNSMNTQGDKLNLIKMRKHVTTKNHVEFNLKKTEYVPANRKH